MRLELRLLMIPLLGLLFGCSTPEIAQTWSNPRTTKASGYSYRIGEFNNANLKGDIEKFPEAETVISESLETALLQADYQVLGNGETDAIITGTINNYYRGNFMGRYTTVGFDVKATDCKTGEILWKASHSITTKWEYDYPPSLLANRVSQELVKQLSCK